MTARWKAHLDGEGDLNQPQQQNTSFQPSRGNNRIEQVSLSVSAWSEALIATFEAVKQEAQ